MKQNVRPGTKTSEGLTDMRVQLFLDEKYSYFGAEAIVIFAIYCHYWFVINYKVHSKIYTTR